MQFNDIFLTIVIILIFIIINVLNLLSGGISHVKNNWPLYRCNPLIMPMAGYFGHDVNKNFTYCIQNMQKSYMGHILKPIHYNTSVISNSGNILLEAINKIRYMLSHMRGFLGSIIQSVFGVFLNIVIQIQKIMIIVKDTFGKVIGIVVTQIYFVRGFVNFLESVIGGPPGKAFVRLTGAKMPKKKKK